MVEAPPSPPRRLLGTLWPHLRMLFILFHVTAVSIAALPSTGSAMKRSAWEDPTVQAEFAAWAPRLGLSVSALSDHLWDVAKGWNRAQNALTAPFRPYLRLTHATQSWQMFVAPHTFPTRLQIRERRAPASAGEGAWETLYEEQSETARWHVEALRVERLRATIFRWGWSSYASAFRSGCHALAQVRFAEDPTVTGFRCRFSKARTPSPAEVRAGKVPPVTWLDPVEVAR